MHDEHDPRVVYGLRLEAAARIAYHWRRAFLIRRYPDDTPPPLWAELSDDARNVHRATVDGLFRLAPDEVRALAGAADGIR